jgi:FkbM family methyltransferase
MGIRSVGGIGAETARKIWVHPENRGRRFQRLGRWVGWQVWQRTVRRPWTIPLHTARLVVHPHDHIGSMAIYYGIYDSEEMRFLLSWLDAGDTFLDVGANIAPYSLLATTVSDVRAVAFEPNEAAYERARRNAEINGVVDRLTIVPAAVGDDDGVARLSTDDWATNHLVQEGETLASVEVPLLRIDSYDAQHGLGSVALMKIDVEGHELAVLRGAKKVLDRDQPALIVEVNDPVDGLRRSLAALGYTPVHFDPESGTIVEREFPDRRGGNLLAVADLDAARERLQR